MMETKPQRLKTQQGLKKEFGLSHEPPHPGDMGLALSLVQAPGLPYRTVMGECPGLGVLTPADAERLAKLDYELV